MLGMLLCLTREPRITFILGAIFEVPVAATPDDLFRSHPRGDGPDFAKELVRLVEAGIHLAPR